MKQQVEHLDIKNAKPKKISIKPVGDHLLVEAVEAAPLSTILVIPDSAKQPSQQFIVRALGDGRVPHNVGLMTDPAKYAEFRVKVGETVLIGKYAGAELELDGKQYKLIVSNDILAIITEA